MTGQQQKEESLGCGVLGCFSLLPLTLLCLASLVAYDSYFRPKALRNRARGWQETSCVTEHCEIAHYAPAGTKMPGVERLEVAYRYVFEGREYVSDKVDFLQEYGKTEYATLGADNNRYVAEYPPGTPTVCYVDPQDANESVLLPNRSQAIALFVPVLLACAGFVFGIPILWYYFSGH